ncbi:MULTISPECIES: hypothetical protein [Saccharothrix]|uniref:hypothetical protein n=1 Tax=Saccharothrix TaxID=2071 RepID=UPI00093C18BF|nr:hypothetical protein [Saccharothrix sp. CB00851]OKI18113.1 hypothetical protein A6A25_11060 [Saccharothrix sp. CB00851]
MVPTIRSRCSSWSSSASRSWAAGSATAGFDASSPADFTHTHLNRVEGGSCAESSYGQVRDYLAAHPCTSLTRVLYDASDGTGTARVAVAWVTMPDSVQAAELKTLVDRHGTGNITELTKDGIRFTGLRYASRIDGNTIVLAQAERAPGSTLADPVLKAAATEAITLAR